MPKTDKKTKLIFRWTGYANYTLSALIGLLDEKLASEKFEITTGENLRDIKKKLSRHASRAILAYSFCSPLFAKVKKEIRAVKDAFGKRILIICGGPHATALPESVIEAGADLVFTGEAEESLPDFLVSYHETGAVPAEKFVKPLPLKDFNGYPPFAYKRNFFAPVEIRRGCRSRCSFCQTPKMSEGIKERSAEYVKKYFPFVKKTGRDVLYFLTPDALSYGSRKGAVDLAYIEDFLNNLKSAGVKINFGNFPSEVSPRNLARFPEAASMLKKYVSNTKIHLGGQSGSEKVLGIMKRDHTVDDVIQSAGILKKAGFLPVIDILFGVPGETKRDRLETLKLMRLLSSKYGAKFNAHYFIPLPSTPFAGLAPENMESPVIDEISSFIRNGEARGDFFRQLRFVKKGP